ncbi:hypothetical protein WA026_002437 [Henosepilachna vigintioctopunctata]|uniref:Uncharacterized protein n=1 Tax=Henosepilachna vigintioctopunctata TaxID=420089 RepID=A0AAW1U2B9_9CUCU
MLIADSISSKFSIASLENIFLSSVSCVSSFSREICSRFCLESSPTSDSLSVVFLLFKKSSLVANFSDCSKFSQEFSLVSSISDSVFENCLSKCFSESNFKLEIESVDDNS